jgi:hypothetical protein
MRRGQLTTIDPGDGTELAVHYLGRGAHATAYQHGLTVYLLVDEDDNMKEALELFVPDGTPHVPPVKRLGTVCKRGKCRNVYTMPYYRTVTAKDKEAWAVVKLLESTRLELHRTRFVATGKCLSVYGIELMYEVIQATRTKVPESVTEALEALSYAGSNYGCGVTFEFGRRNIGVDERGGVVFRDVLFDAAKVMAKWRVCR